MELLEKIKNNSSHFHPYPIVRVGHLGLMRSKIPVVDCKRVVFHLDDSSLELLSVKALQMKMTPDELIRQAVWSLLAD